MTDKQASIHPVNAIGRHIIIDFWGGRNLKDAQIIESALIQAAEAAHAVLLNIHVHEFQNGGLTGVALLAESHISLHTWPEFDYAAFDIFMCGNAMPDKAVDVLIKVFEPQKVKTQELLRGCV